MPWVSAPHPEQRCMLLCFLEQPLSCCHGLHKVAPVSLTRSALLKRSTKVSNWSSHVRLAAQKMTGMECLCLLRQTAHTGSTVGDWGYVLRGWWAVDWDGCCASAQKEHVCLLDVVSGCFLEGRDTGHLERLGDREWLGLLSVLVAAVWYESGLYDWWV